ncbi:hypothetical protein BZG36_02391 [Bifiguratus adelaidae]|uniref:Cyclin N-terminal domain-containing protein n=1 Tax=Bifiguratus adelaidae TaxID=1938954 RepID=A0A261Y159_9FUNG|nr:hypothetical protein BZG36_02391 [Bifiguratus adelaidae]
MAQRSTLTSHMSATTAIQLANLCAFMVPFMWYGKECMRWYQPFDPAQPKRNDKDPFAHFGEFCHYMFSKTQISDSCVCLSLKYIQRLKRANPDVKGAPGSEFRLFTVALMLANKFLNDNTYSNKSWAQVSKLNVREINIMEIEFLVALKYNLYCSQKEFGEWHARCQQLGISRIPVQQARSLAKPSPHAMPVHSYRNTVYPCSPPMTPPSQPQYTTPSKLKRSFDDITNSALINTTTSPDIPGVYTPRPVKRTHLTPNYMRPNQYTIPLQISPPYANALFSLDSNGNNIPLNPQRQQLPRTYNLTPPPMVPRQNQEAFETLRFDSIPRFNPWDHSHPYRAQMGGYFNPSVRMADQVSSSDLAMPDALLATQSLEWFNPRHLSV